MLVHRFSFKNKIKLFIKNYWFIRIVLLIINYIFVFIDDDVDERKY